VSPRDLPLAGVVVADFSRVLAGPLCTMVHADLGADVIKIERPGVGDDTRAWGPPFVGDDAAYFMSTNRDKRSIALDLTDPDDLSTSLDIVDRADIVVENFRPGVMEGFGLGYEQLRHRCPKLVYCSVRAFMADDAPGDAGYDLLMQAASGFMSVTGERGRPPVKMGAAILDVVAGLYLSIGVLGALRDRDTSGAGRHVKVGLFDASIAALVNQAASHLLAGVVPVAQGTEHPSIVPYQVFATADGSMALAAGNDKLYRRACGALGRDDLANDARFATNSGRVEHRHELVETFSAVLASRPTHDWIERFHEAGVPVAPVRRLDEVFESPEGRSTVISIDDPDRGPLRLVRSPLYGIGLEASDHRRPPLLGEHDREIRDWLEGDA